MTNLQMFISLSVVIGVTFIWFGCSLAFIEIKLEHLERQLEVINKKEKTNE